MGILDEILDKVVGEEITIGNLVGANIIVAQGGRVIYENSFGFADREQQKQMTPETIIRLASLTKPLVTAAAMALLESGIIKLDDQVTKWLSYFVPKNPDGTVTPIQLRHLLNHTSGLGYGFLSADNEPYKSAGVSDGLDDSGLSLEENLRRLASVPLLFKPGTSWCYSLSTDVLGAVMEKACQKPLSEIVEEHVTGPLKMSDTTFLVKDVDRLAVAYADKSADDEAPRRKEAEDRVLLDGCGPIHYAPGRIMNPRAYPSGGAGMAGTARDYLKFLETIRQGGVAILKKKSVSLMTEDLVPDFEVPAAGPGFGFGMGFAVVRDSEMANTAKSRGTYEWGGVYGAKMYVDPERELSVVILTNTALYGLMHFPTIIEKTLYGGRLG